jgi:hypothetical protein
MSSAIFETIDERRQSRPLHTGKLIQDDPMPVASAPAKQIGALPL